MYVMKRPSNGRGEYEIADRLSYIGPQELLERELRVDYGPLGVKRSAITLREQGGKFRLRIMAYSVVHLVRQVEAALMLPKSIREERMLTGGRPVIMAERYLMRKMQIARVDDPATSPILTFSRVELANASHYAEEIEVPARLARVKYIHDHVDELPDPLKGAVRLHAQYVSGDGPVSALAEQSVQRIMTAMRDLAPEYDIEYAYGTDVVEAIEQLFDDPPQLPTTPPIPIEEIAPEEVEVRRREAKKMLREVALRGAASRRFSRLVNAAYGSRCVMCGIRLPSGQGCRNPGVDAAHILAWSNFDLDVVANGLCLCKLHHWAYDNFVLTVVPTTGGYRVALTETGQTAFAADQDVLTLLRTVVGPIPANRLPVQVADRPKPEWLQRRDDDLGVVPVA